MSEFRRVFRVRIYTENPFLLKKVQEEPWNGQKNSFERRKAVIYDMICDKQYVPMKKKEIAALLQIPKEERGRPEGSAGSSFRRRKDRSLSKGKVPQSGPARF